MDTILKIALSTLALVSVLILVRFAYLAWMDKEF